MAPRSEVRFATLLGSCVLALLLACSPAGAARKPITGKLSKPNYTVIALEPSGKAAVVRARRGRFKVRPPAQSVTLQLRAPNGSYAGPVVVRRVKKKAILGVRPGARLGKVRVRRGYARVKKRLGEESVDTGVLARAKRGVPIGARRFGRVRSRKARNRGFGDRDLDGIPDVLDVDDDGDLILDRADTSTPSRSARTSQGPGEYFGFFSRLTLYLNDTANANASSLSTQQVDAALSSHGDLLLNVLDSDPLPNSPELNCGGSIQQPPRPVGLIYCRPHSAGGVGTIHRYPPFSDEVAFPDCCDLDDDGLGKLTDDTGALGEPQTAMTLHHNATTSQIGTGDVMIQTTTKDGVTTSFLAALQYILATVPAMVSYNDDAPGGATQIPYPFPGPDPGTGMGGGPGLRGNPAPVSDGPDADDDVELTVTFWRPQRRAVPAWGESGTWIDIGGLHYEVQVRESGRRCPQDAFTENHPELSTNNPSTSVNPGLTDLAPDRPADPANKFTYTLNLTRCLEANGFSWGNEGHAFSFLATNPNGPDNSQQTVFFKRQ
jgi:hypothetical protein